MDRQKMYRKHAKEQRFADGEGAELHKVCDAGIVLLDGTKAADSEGDRKLTFVISTDDVDRHGDKIFTSGWVFDHWLANPVMLWAHNSNRLPIAKGSNPVIEAHRVLSDAEFAGADVDITGFAESVYKMYVNRFLSAVSVGFKALEFVFVTDREGWYPMDITKAELFEYSAVPIPANPFALEAAKSAGINMVPMLEWATMLLDENASVGSAKDVEPEVILGSTEFHKELSPKQFAVAFCDELELRESAKKAEAKARFDEMRKEVALCDELELREAARLEEECWTQEEIDTAKENGRQMIERVFGKEKEPEVIEDDNFLVILE